jgi:hypothetical protein
MVSIKLDEKKMQKNRFFRKPKNIRLIYGESGLVVIKEGRIELIHLTLLKRLLKSLIVKKKNEVDYSREKI